MSKLRLLPRMWTDAEVRLLRGYHSQGMKFADMARRLNRTVDSVSMKLVGLGLGRQRNARKYIHIHPLIGVASESDDRVRAIQNRLLELLRQTNAAWDTPLFSGGPSPANLEEKVFPEWIADIRAMIARLDAGD